MQNVLNATDVRKEWGRFIDNVVRNKPSLVKRNRDYFAAISLEHLEDVLASYRFTMEYEKEEDCSFSGFLEGFDILANAPTLDELKDKLVIELMEYSLEYMDEFDLYYRSKNRRKHFPYIMRVLTQKDELAVKDLIDA